MASEYGGGCRGRFPAVGVVLGELYSIVLLFLLFIWCLFSSLAADSMAVLLFAMIFVLSWLELGQELDFIGLTFGLLFELFELEFVIGVEVNVLVIDGDEEPNFNVKCNTI